MAKTTKAAAAKATAKTTEEKKVATKATTKTTAKKATSKVAAPVTEEKKVVETVKAEEKVAPAKVETKEEKAPAKETKTTKTTAKATKSSTKATKTTAVKEEVKAEVVVEYAGTQVSIEKVIDDVKKTFASEGNTEEIKSVKVYLKPEESAAYYVINDTIEGRMDVYFC